MKTTGKIATLIIATFLVQAPLGTLAYYEESYTEDWEIPSFHTDIQIEKDSTVEIKETIVADFTNEAHRGIARIIPFEYETGDFSKTRDAKLEFLSATNEEGDSWNINTYESYGYLNIEMTNKEDEYRNDINTFVVRYLVRNTINFFDTHDEFYWNVNGTDWVVPMEEVTAKVTLPEEIAQSEVQVECYTGIYGDTEKNCTWEFEDEKTISFKATKEFEPYENLSIVIGLPKGTLTPPSTFKKIWWFLKANKGILLIPLTLIFMFLLWQKKGRDEKTLKDTIMPHYKPPEGLLPTETGTIIDEKINPQDITATIIDFAIKGFIRINEIEKKKLIGTKTEYELELIKPYKTTKEFEKLIMEGIFSTNEAGTKIKIDDLKNKFYKHIPKIKKSVMKSLIDEKYFPHNPATIRAVYTGIGGAIIFISFQLMGVFVSTGIGLMISGIIIILFGLKMPRKTQKGAETYYILKGLYEYIDTAEKDRMKFQEENKILFEKLLPYAISFGLAKKWAKAFEDIIKTPPNWYNSTRTNYKVFYMSRLANSINSFNRTLTTNMTSKPGSRGGGGWSGSSGFGGGGFSGGGFGGGGGRGL